MNRLILLGIKKTVRNGFDIGIGRVLGVNRKVVKMLVASVYAALGLIAILCAFVIILIEAPVCNIHGHKNSVSPDGLWRARWSTTGCSRFFLTVFWHSKITVSKMSGAARVSYVVFKSDSPHSVTLTWPEPDTLNIEIDHVAYITRSDLNVSGLAVTYSVRNDALDYANKFIRGESERIARLRANDPSAGPRPNLQDRQAEERVDENYRDYLERFEAWAQRYALPPAR